MLPSMMLSHLPPQKQPRLLGGYYNGPPAAPTTFDFDMQSASRVVIIARAVAASGGIGNIGFDTVAAPASLIGRIRGYAQSYDDYQGVSLAAYAVPDGKSLTISAWGAAANTGRGNRAWVWEIENCPTRTLLNTAMTNSSNTITATTSPLDGLVAYVGSKGTGSYGDISAYINDTFEKNDIASRQCFGLDLNPAPGSQAYSGVGGGAHAILSLGV